VSTETAMVLQRDIPITSMAEMQQAGELLARSGMFGINNPAAGFVVAMTCFQQRITPLDFSRTYHVVQGRPSMKADAMMAEFRKRGGKIKILKNTTEEAAAEFTFEGQTYNGIYTMADARRTCDCFDGGKKLKDNWEKRPDDMLWARLVSRSIRRLCPEINAGIYTPEEVEDFSPAAPASREPVAIDPVEAAKRVHAVVVEKAAPVAPQATDFTVCPVDGQMFGVKWDSMDAETLGLALSSLDLEAGYMEAIKTAIAAKTEGK